MSEAKEIKAPPAIRFANSVVETCSNPTNVTPHQFELITNYYSAITKVLNEKNYSWNQVNLEPLKKSLFSNARLGLDMNIDNHLSAVPYFSSKTGIVTVNLIRGYEGRKFIAKKFAMDEVKDIIVELIGENDTFKIVKRDYNHDHDDYIYEQTNPFDKGKIIGGFAYIVYPDATKNKLIVMDIKQITDHEPTKGNPFWHGKWKEKMWKKTLMVAACKEISLDPTKTAQYQEELSQIEADDMANEQIVQEDTIQSSMDNADMVDIEADFVELDEEPPFENVDTGTEEISK